MIKAWVQLNRHNLCSQLVVFHTAKRNDNHKLETWIDKRVSLVKWKRIGDSTHKNKMGSNNHSGGAILIGFNIDLAIQTKAHNFKLYFRWFHVIHSITFLLFEYAMLIFRFAANEVQGHRWVHTDAQRDKYIS